MPEHDRVVKYVHTARLATRACLVLLEKAAQANIKNPRN